MEQTLTRHSESKLEETECLLDWDWLGLTGRRVRRYQRILEPEKDFSYPSHLRGKETGSSQM